MLRVPPVMIRGKCTMHLGGSLQGAGNSSFGIHVKPVPLDKGSCPKNDKDLSMRGDCDRVPGRTGCPLFSEASREEHVSAH